MSKTAIKNFFDYERKVTARRNEYYERLLEKMNAVCEDPVDTSVFDKEVAYFDTLLKRNWFLDNEDIYELLMDADEDIFEEIVTRIATYPTNVQQIIAAFRPLAMGNVTLKIRVIDNDEMELRDYKAQEARRKMLADAWEAHKINKNLQPPVGSLDAELDDMFAYLQNLKKELEVTKKKTLAGRYVPPAMRDVIIGKDPKVIEILKKIEKSENGILHQNQFIEQEKNEWFMRKRCEFEETMFAV